MSLPALTDEQFDATIQQHTDLVLVDFWAKWCGPCKALAPILEEVNQARDDLSCYQIDVDAERETAARYHVRGIPTLLLFSKGELIGTQVGAVSKTQLLSFIDEKSKESQ